MNNTSKFVFTDHLHRTICLEHFPPQRIISLVPSQTELLFSMGLSEKVIGITKFCVHPEEWYVSKKKVGGTKTVHFEKVAALQPHLIIGNKEENMQDQLETLANWFPVWVSDIQNVEDAIRLPIDFAEILGTEISAAQQLSHQIQQSILLKNSFPHRRAAYFIWRKPYMVAGGDTYINSMMSVAGFENVFENQPRYPEISEEDLRAAQPEIILLSSEPYPFAEKHRAIFQEICPAAHVLVVDGEMFSWYGSRMLLAGDYFLKIRTEIEQHFNLQKHS